jgi:hypothetical protein
MSAMTKGEREDLQRLIRQREKVQISAAKQRSADLLADFENQMGSVYRPEDDQIWTEAENEARQEVAKAQRRIAARCRELGIPDGFAPGLSLDWNHRGWNNALEKRRTELRSIAKAQIAALEQKAIVRIQQASVEAQTELALAGLTSEAARAFVAKLPTVESLMPALSYQELAGDADPPVVEQLITPNALRQRRYRERRKALRDGSGDGGGPPLPPSSVRPPP